MDTLRLIVQDYDIDLEKESHLIQWEDSDTSKDPMKWSIRKRFICTAILSLISFTCTFASSIGSGTEGAVMSEFGVSKEVATLSTSLFLVGFATGAPVLAPLCEEFGRLPIYVISMTLFSCFEIGAGASNNMAALAICRFFAGFFGTTPLSNAGGSIADMWEADHRTLIFPFFGVSGFLGPCLGPVAGSYLTVSRLGWRWTNYIVAILGFLLASISAVFMPETYKPIIMDFKASSIRRKTGDDRYRSLHEIERDGRSPFSIKVFLRPFVFFFTQPMVTCFTLIISITYMVLFTDFEEFSAIFATWNFSTTKSSLPFISVTLGVLFSLFVVAPLSYLQHMRQAKIKGSISKVAPENRLIPLMICSWCIPISLFWTAWTNYKHISPWSTIVSTFFFGVGMMQVFLTSYSYIIDSYGINSASALSTLTLVRYNVSAASVHFAEPMYKNLGVHWAVTLLACLSILICIMPFIFWYIGPRVRARSKFTTPGI